MQFVVDRSKWGRGVRGPFSKLLTPTGEGIPEHQQGKMCCLGFRCLAEPGVTPDDIRNVGLPASVLKIDPVGNVTGKAIPGMHPHYLTEEGHNSPLTLVLAEVNDNPDLKSSDRESMLRHLFQIAGDEVAFISGNVGNVGD